MMRLAMDGASKGEDARDGDAAISRRIEKP